MKFAIAGCQHVHIKMFIDEMLELGHEFIGIYDPSSFYLPKQYAEVYGVPMVPRLEDLIAQGVEVIGNAASNDEKIEIIEWGERHGIDVMTDKPIAVDEEALQRLRSVIERGKISVGMMLTERFEPAIYTLKQLIDQGELGEVLDFTFLKPHKVNRAKRPDWFFDKRVNGGLIIDIMIHDVDTIRWLSGKDVVEHHGGLIKNDLYEYPTFYNNAFMNLLLEDHVTAALKTDWLMPEAFDSWGDGRIFVTGSKGRVEIRSAGDILGEPGPFLTLTTHRKKAERVEVMKVPHSLAEDFLLQRENKPHVLTKKDIYDCNALVLKMDAAASKLTKEPAASESPR